jgi:hypothetical protein
LIDTAFIDPANAGTANVKPASIANGAPHSRRREQAMRTTSVPIFAR